eukprot:gene694-biopygen2201
MRAAVPAAVGSFAHRDPGPVRACKPASPRVRRRSCLLLSRYLWGYERPRPPHCDRLGAPQPGAVIGGFRLLTNMGSQQVRGVGSRPPPPPPPYTPSPQRPPILTYVTYAHDMRAALRLRRAHRPDAGIPSATTPAGGQRSGRGASEPPPQEEHGRMTPLRRRLVRRVRQHVVDGS